jgi:hypothetical protein
MPTPQLDGFVARVMLLKRQLSQLVLDARELPLIPSGGLPDERLTSLLELWELLGLPSPAENSAPAKALSDQIRGYLEPNTAATVADSFRDLALNLDAAIGAAARASTSANPAIVLSRDFGNGNGVRFITTAQAHLPMAYALYDSLPGDHFLRRRISASDCSQQAEGPTLRLGLCAGTLAQPRARSWYPTASVLKLTAIVRDAQRAKEAEEAADKERQEAAKRERRFVDPFASQREWLESQQHLATLTRG